MLQVTFIIFPSVFLFLVSLIVTRLMKSSATFRNGGVLRSPLKLGSWSICYINSCPRPVFEVNFFEQFRSTKNVYTILESHCICHPVSVMPGNCVYVQHTFLARQILSSTAQDF